MKDPNEVKQYLLSLNAPRLPEKAEFLDLVCGFRLLLGRQPSVHELDQLEWKSKEYTLGEFLKEICGSEEFKKQPVFCLADTI